MLLILLKVLHASDIIICIIIITFDIDNLASTLCASTTKTKVVNKAARKLSTAIREMKRKELSLSSTAGEEAHLFVDLAIDNCDSMCTGFESVKNDSYWIEDLLLMKSDRLILESSNDWLNSSIVDASQRVLAQQFKKDGLQEVGNGLTMSFEIETGEFIQILHDPNGHWLCICNTGAAPNEVFVYDSLFTSCSPEVVQAITCILQPTASSIILSFVDMHKQTGGADCGIFAIASATALCMGLQPGKYILDQGLIRRHLLHCLENMNFSLFPSRRERRIGHRISSHQIVNIHCVCRMPAIPGLEMLCCDICKEWYHGTVCLDDVPAEAWQKEVSWKCSFCK